MFDGFTLLATTEVTIRIRGWRVSPLEQFAKAPGLKPFLGRRSVDVLRVPMSSNLSFDLPYPKDAYRWLEPPPAFVTISDFGRDNGAALVQRILSDRYPEMIQ